MLQPLGGSMIDGHDYSAESPGPQADSAFVPRLLRLHFWRGAGRTSIALATLQAWSSIVRGSVQHGQGGHGLAWEPKVIWAKCND